MDILKAESIGAVALRRRRFNMWKQYAALRLLLRGAQGTVSVKRRRRVLGTTLASW